MEKLQLMMMINILFRMIGIESMFRLNIKEMVHIISNRPSPALEMMMMTWETPDEMI